MAELRVTPLGAGQDVGRSCILLTIGGKNIMLDCGMHMGYNDERRFPDFTYITRNEKLTDHLDCVIISHFHLDHCGALPFMSEMVGYDGPIYMTHPTKAICPILQLSFLIFSVFSKCKATEMHAEIDVYNKMNFQNCYIRFERFLEFSCTFLPLT